MHAYKNTSIDTTSKIIIEKRRHYSHYKPCRFEVKSKGATFFLPMWELGFPELHGAIMNKVEKYIIHVLLGALCVCSFVPKNPGFPVLLPNEPTKKKKKKKKKKTQKPRSPN